MKVLLTEKSKREITINQLPAALEIIADCKEDMTTEKYAEMALRIISGFTAWRLEVYKATAEIVKNENVLLNRFNEDSRDLDIWISGIGSFEGRTGDEIYKFGVYLSDLWELLADYSNWHEIRSRMFIKRYKEVME